MKKTLIIISLIISTISLQAQTGTIVTGEGSGENIWRSSEYITVFGDSALVNSTSGDNLTVLGYHAGYSNTAGSDNTFLGYQAGYSAGDYNSDNLMIGHQAGYSNTTYDNTFIGRNAGYHNTTGQDNTFIGYLAGEDAIDGDDNIYIGYLTGHDMNGNNNILIGRSAGFGYGDNNTGNGNVGLGTQCDINDIDYGLIYFGALNDLQEGQYNSVFGSGAGVRIRNGNYNTLLGFDSGNRLTHENGNTYIGFRSGYFKLGGKNVLIGSEAGDDGFRNSENLVYVGHQSGGWNAPSNTICLGVYARAVQHSVSIGYSTGLRQISSVGLGYDGESNSSGSIGLGYKFRIDRGDYSIGIGDQADIDNAYAVGIGTNVNIDNTEAIAIGDNTSATGNYSIAYGPGASVSGNNSVALGNGASVTTDHTITIGNTAVTSIRGTVNWTTLSDGRYKTDVKEAVPGLTFINALRPVSYELKSQPDTRYSGFIAQEVETTAEDIAYDFSGIKQPQNEEDHYGLRYAAFVVPLTKAVQELAEEQQANENLITKNDAKLQHYASAIAQLKAKVQQLEQAKAAAGTTAAID
ncbi:MAG: tail fiber domain-containing protein [Bacteroidota bacterium]